MSFLSFMRISTASLSDWIHTTSIPGMIDASHTFARGRNILFIPTSRARIVAGKAHCMARIFPSRASSHRKIDDSTISVLKSYSFPRIQSAIGRSYTGHFFLISAGARFTVMRDPLGNLNPPFFRALRTLSRLSWMAASPSHTMVKFHIPVTTSTSTSTRLPLMPYSEEEKSFCI